VLLQNLAKKTAAIHADIARAPQLS
jgi:hypothetical protein